MTATLLGAILEGAEERGLIDRNPARGKRRRARERAPIRSHLDAAEPIRALLDAAGELDREARADHRHLERRAMLATLMFEGLRISELVALRWRDLDLAGGWLHTGSKTDAGWRQVKIRSALRDVLLDLRARRSPAQDAFIFATSTGGRMNKANFRSRTLKAAVMRANKNLAQRDLQPLPERITPHSLCRTFCSLLYALGEDPGVVMDEMGHTDPSLALRVYRQSMRRGEDERAQLRALVEGADLGAYGRTGRRRAQKRRRARGQKRPEPAPTQAISRSGRLDSNQRPLAPKASALPGCATPRRPLRVGIAPGLRQGRASRHTPSTPAPRARC